MNTNALREALDDANSAHDRLAAGESLIFHTLLELPGNDPLYERLHYLIEAQECFRKKADEAVQAAWAEVFTAEKARRGKKP
ncbi:hypothetical protein [Roseomonas haemaphysalidis]|uniref:Uncharacterized protein n=1 Tax=Roseomonas haemaphysalidis TaxID=2768162 RepID=A0ABS3KWI6_9PROT|nr:hypothetical protein [Roseomonas haemaphysalidis]MBO1081838.1 hypothetical protein [Roseomonas haemaphysalidis]